jgi:hypothetical protein
MNNKIKYSILYDYKKINYKIIILLSIVLFLLIGYMYKDFITLNSRNQDELNLWGLYCFELLDNSLVLGTLQFFNFYFIFNCFENDKVSMFLKVRINDSSKWFTSKIISIFIFNLVTISVISIIILIFGVLLFGYKGTWESINRPWVQYFSFVQVILITIIIYSCITTTIGEVLGFFITKFQRRRISAIAYVIYIIIDRVIFSYTNSFTKVFNYISFSMYTNFSNMRFPSDIDNNISINNFTVKEAFIMSSILMLSIYFIIAHIYRNKKSLWIKL